MLEAGPSPVAGPAAGAAALHLRQKATSVSAWSGVGHQGKLVECPVYVGGYSICRHAFIHNAFRRVGDCNYHLSQHLFPSWLETSYFLFQSSLYFFPCAYVRVSNCFLYIYFYPLYNRCYSYCLRLQVCRVQFSILEGCLYSMLSHPFVICLAVGV